MFQPVAHYGTKENFSPAAPPAALAVCDTDWQGRRPEDEG